MADNRKQRRARESLERKNLKRYAVRASGDRPTRADGVLVFFDKILQHPVYGPIHVVVDERVEEEVGLITNSLLNLRGVPATWSPPETLSDNDPYVQWYAARGVDLDHAKRMASGRWRIEVEDIRNSSYILAMFSYIDFEGEPPEDLDWKTPEELERYDLPPRPEVRTNFNLERRLLFVKDLIRSQEAFTITIEDEEVDFPGFYSQFMAAMQEVNKKIEKLRGEGVIPAEEPVDSETGFLGVDAGSDVYDDDDAESAEA